MTHRTLLARFRSSTEHTPTRRLHHALAVGITCLLGMATSPTGWTATRPDPALIQPSSQSLSGQTLSSQTLFNRLSAEPLRYAGLSSTQNRRILVGLHPTGPGTVSGEMMQMDSAMRPLAGGMITGTLTPPTSTRLGSCHLKVTLSDRDLLLDGPCSETLLSGALTTHPRPRQLWSQVTNFISPDTSISQYWLSRKAWQAAITPTPAP